MDGLQWKTLWTNGWFGGPTPSFGNTHIFDGNSPVNPQWWPSCQPWSATTSRIDDESLIYQTVVGWVGWCQAHRCKSDMFGQTACRLLVVHLVWECWRKPRIWSQHAVGQKYHAEELQNSVKTKLLLNNNAREACFYSMQKVQCVSSLAISCYFKLDWLSWKTASWVEKG